MLTFLTKSTGKTWLVAGAISVLGLFGLSACGTDFPEPEPISASEPTPSAVPTIYRTISVTPAPTRTPVPLDEGEFYSGEDQRAFPPQIDGSGSKTPLPGEAVLGLWKDYLTDAHVVIAERGIDMHLCDDGRIIPGSDDGVVQRGSWGLRQSGGDWFEAMVGRQFGRGRLAGIATFSRNGGRTVMVDDGIALASVTDSDRC